MHKYHHMTCWRVTERNKGMTKMKRGGEKKISLEEYVDFFTSDKSIDFTISYLNQILHMHGFRKLHKSNKKTVGGAVEAVDLLDLSRSTLKESAVSSSLSVDQVISDMEALKWQECCITSLLIINSEQVCGAEPKPKPKQKSNKRKKSMKAIIGDENDNKTIVIPAIPKKMRNKKTKKNANMVTFLNQDAAPSHNNTIP